MRFADWHGIVVGLLMLGQWAPVGMFAVLLAFALVCIAKVIHSRTPEK